MSIVDEPYFLATCVEGFFYGLYSGIFAMYYLQSPSKKSGTAITLFYAVCLLYVLSTATFVSDLVALIFFTRVGTLSHQLQIDIRPMLSRIPIIQTTLNGCCDFLAQCILIYRCWIVWSQDIRVVIIPLFLAIAYLALWLAGLGALAFVQGQIGTAGWGIKMGISSLTTSMAVNALVTGLIIFKILKVFLEVRVNLSTSISVERTFLGSTRGHGNTKLRQVIFVIIESGMTLFAIQLLRLLFYILPMKWTADASDYVIVINVMFNGIIPTIILVRASTRVSFDDTESFKEAAGSLLFNNPPSDPSTTTSSSMSPDSDSPQLGPQLESQEISEDTTIS